MWIHFLLICYTVPQFPVKGNGLVETRRVSPVDGVSVSQDWASDSGQLVPDNQLLYPFSKFYLKKKIDKVIANSYMLSLYRMIIMDDLGSFVFPQVFH